MSSPTSSRASSRSYARNYSVSASRCRSRSRNGAALEPRRRAARILCSVAAARPSAAAHPLLPRGLHWRPPRHHLPRQRRLRGTLNRCLNRGGTRLGRRSRRCGDTVPTCSTSAPPSRGCYRGSSAWRPRCAQASRRSSTERTTLGRRMRSAMPRPSRWRRRRQGSRRRRSTVMRNRSCSRRRRSAARPTSVPTSSQPR